MLRRSGSRIVEAELPQGGAAPPSVVCVRRWRLHTFEVF